MIIVDVEQGSQSRNGNDEIKRDNEMSKLLSGWININTYKPVYADVCSHSDTARLLKWTPDDLARHREWEWTEGDASKLTVRTSPDDPPELAERLRSELIGLYGSRDAALVDGVRNLHPSVKGLDLRTATIPADLVIPASVTALYLYSATIPAGLVIPESVTTLDLSDTTIPAGLVIPASVTTLYMRAVTIPADLAIPASVTTLDLCCATIPADLVIPESVTTLYMLYATIPADLVIPDGCKVIR